MKSRSIFVILSFEVIFPEYFPVLYEIKWGFFIILQFDIVLSSYYRIDRLQVLFTVALEEFLILYEKFLL